MSQAPRLPLKSILKKSIKRKENNNKSVSFLEKIIILERDNLITTMEIPYEEDNYELHIPKTKISSPPISTSKLKKLSQKGITYLTSDKKARKRQQLQNLINLHQIDAAQERKKRLLKINKKLGYQPGISNSVPLILRTKQKVIENDQKKLLLTERTVVPCQFLLKTPFNYINNNDENNDNNLNNNNDKNNNNLNNDNKNNNTNDNINNMEDKMELLWLEQLGLDVFCCYENIKDEAIISEAKIFFHCVKLLDQDDRSITILLDKLPIMKVIGIFYNGKMERRKKKEFFERGEATIQFVNSTIKERWVNILFPQKISSSLINNRNELNEFNDDNIHILDNSTEIEVN